MTIQAPASDYKVDLLNESDGHCDCCGQSSRWVWGLVHRRDETVAAYWMHWTVGHLEDTGANLDLVLGRWGDDVGPEHRVAISLLYREPDGQVMVTDAGDRPTVGGDLASSGLSREEVIGTPLADYIFAIVDAIWIGDRRFL